MGVSTLTFYEQVLKFTQIVNRGAKMAGVTFQFNQTKAIEVILYIISKAPVPNLYGICKLLYLADKASLEKYGRFIFGESYVAMEEGSVPSNAYNLLKNPTNALKREGNHFKASRTPELDYLSRTDIECLDKTLEEFGGRNSWTKRKTACHDAAWEIAWDKRGSSQSYPISIENIAELFEKSDELIDYLSNKG